MRSQHLDADMHNV